jgi:large subunit ribosomal protein L10
MAVSRQTKAKSLEELTGLFAQAQSLVLADYEGLTVVQVDQLRRKCREAGVQYKVVKNRIAKLAIQGTNKEPASKLFKGTIAVAFSNEDAAAPAKVLLDYKKGLDKAIQDKFKVRGAVFEGQVVDAAGVETLSKMPGKNEARAMLLSVFNAPATGFVRVLNAVPQGLLNVLVAQKDKIGGGDAPAA